MSADPQHFAIEPAQLLAALGERVRALRGRRRLTRRRLAADSGVSERYLAELERGRGNVSILLLAKVAAALRVELADLVRGPGQQSAEEILITDLLHQVGPDRHRAILRFLAENYAVPLDSRRRIALVGLRGAGKTSQGEMLAARLGVPFVQLGVDIERLAGMSTSEIFSLSGQAGYRRLEEKALMQALAKHDRCVLETGGSIVMDPTLLDTLLTTCFVAWLFAPPEEYMRRLIEQGDVRPMQDQADALADLRRIVAERREYYARAHASVDTSGRSVEECVAELEALAPAGIRA